jgi:putative DNA primase/helicase
MLNAQSTIVVAQTQLDWLHDQFMLVPSVTPSDEEPKFIDRALQTKELFRALEYLPADSYEDWIQIGMALKQANYDREMWDDWSKKSDKYVGFEEISRKWASFRREDIKLGTIFYLAQKYGFKFRRADDDGGHLYIARETLHSFGVGNLIYCQSRFHRYDGRIWLPCDDKVVEGAIVKQFEILQRHRQLTGGSLTSVLKILKALEEVQRPDDIFSQNLQTICCENGELYFDGKKWILQPHVRENFRQSLVPVHYDPSATSPRFESYLNEIFEADIDRNEKITCTKQLLGYSLTTDCRFERYALLNGEGRNGKGVLLSVLCSLVGKDNYAAVDPGQFDNRFQRSSLRGKLVNVVTELSEGHQINDGSLKAFVSGEPMQAEEKHKAPFSFCPYAKHWFATNHLPYTRDTSKAFFSRPIVLSFNQSFEGTRCDPNLRSKLEKELPGILLLALDGLASLHMDNQFTEPQSSIAAKEAWNQDVDQVALFISERCIRGDYSVPVSEVFNSYESWAHQAGMDKKLSKNMFSRRIKRYGVRGEDGTGGRRLFRGIQLLKRAAESWVL